jgi:hypothetical protein
MTTHRATWTSGLGVPHTTITIDLDHDAQRVTVDRPTLDRMAESVLTAGILADDDAADLATAIRARPGLDRIDVTDVGGGWSQWLDSVDDCGCGHVSHPGRPCDGKGEDLDPMYGVPPGEPCVCTTDADPNERT